MGGEAVCAGDVDVDNGLVAFGVVEQDHHRGVVEAFGPGERDDVSAKGVGLQTFGERKLAFGEEDVGEAEAHVVGSASESRAIVDLEGTVGGSYARMGEAIAHEEPSGAEELAKQRETLGVEPA